jgi:hypothetical protein
MLVTIEIRSGQFHDKCNIKITFIIFTEYGKFGYMDFIIYRIISFNIFYVPETGSAQMILSFYLRYIFPGLQQKYIDL